MRDRNVSVQGCAFRAFSIAFWDCAANVPSSRARTEASMPAPGRKALTRPTPIPTEVPLAKTVYRSVFKPMRPIFLTSPSSRTPSTSEEKTSGTTIMKISRRKICPSGWARLRIVHSTHGSPGAIAWTVSPATVPKRSP